MKKVIIEMENGEVMTGELYEDIAPITVENFEKLANDGFYDGLTFHRVIPGFMPLSLYRRRKQTPCGSLPGAGSLLQAKSTSSGSLFGKPGLCGGSPYGRTSCGTSA